MLLGCDNIPGGSSDTKYFELGGLKINVSRRGYNEIAISKYVCKIKTEKNEYIIDYDTNGYVYCNSIDEARQYINKIRQDYKLYQELLKKLNLSSDFV